MGTSKHSTNTNSQYQPCGLQPSSSKNISASNLPGANSSSIKKSRTSKTFNNSETSSNDKYNYESMKNFLQQSSGEVLARFQITISYGGIIESFVANLERGLQINLDSNYNELFKKRDEVMKELIEEIGTNVKVFKYSGGGIILKFKKKQLKAYRLCQHRVFFSRFGGEKLQKIERSCETSGRSSSVAFCYRKYFAGLKNGQVSDFTTTFKFGT